MKAAALSTNGRPGMVLPGLALGAAILFGLLIGIDLGLPLVLVVITTIGAITAYFLGRSATDRYGWLLWSGWLLMLLSNGVQYVTQVPIGYLQELLLFGLAFLVAAHGWRLARSDQTFRLLLVLWLAYFAVSLLSTAIGRSHLLPAIWQLQYNFKWPLMFGLGCLVAWGPAPQTHLRRVVWYSWLILLPCVLLEIAAPGIHSQLFGPPPDLHGNPILGIGLRYRGPFQHSGHLAIAAALLVAISLAELIASGRRVWVLPGFIYLVLLLASGQRQELLALVLSIGLFMAILGWRYWYLLLGFVGIPVVIGVVAMISLDLLSVRPVLAEWGLIEGTAALSERAILTMNGLAVAKDYFPLGSGLGTFGGAGAQKFDQSLYLDLGFARYWWFRQGLFLVDTFWPNVIAESGFLGAALLFALFSILWLTLIWRVLRSRDTPHFAIALSALAALTLILANSPTSAGLTDPRSSFLFWILIGAAWRVTGSFAIGGSPESGRSGARVGGAGG